MAIGYFVAITSGLYFLFIVTMYLISNPTLPVRLAIMILGLAIVYIIAKIFYRETFKINRSSPYIDSLTHVMALMFFLSVGPAILAITGIAGISTWARALYIDAKPTYVNVWNIYLPAYAIILWGCSSIIVAYFYHSVTYELLERRNRFVRITASTAVFTLNYNAPLITNYWNIWDILFFGLAFAYSYSVKKNPVALLSAYLLMEVPLWWCILAPFGEITFAYYFIGRFVITVVALIVLMNKKLIIKGLHESDKCGE